MLSAVRTAGQWSVVLVGCEPWAVVENCMLEEGKKDTAPVPVVQRSCALGHGAFNSLVVEGVCVRARMCLFLFDDQRTRQ